MASSPSEGSTLSMYVWRIKSAEGGRTELGEWAELWQSRDTKPKNQEVLCVQYPSLSPITALAVLSFSLAGCGLMDYGGGGSGTRGTKTYTVRGKTYRPYLSADGYREDGVASWYGRDFHGKTTANGERYNMYAMTAAHKLLPLGTKVRVTHLRNGKSIVVRVNDRGPFVGDRIIDLSYASAKELGMIGTGTARVRVEAIETFGGASPGDMNGSFYIQIAALSSQASAQDLVRRLQNRNLGGRAFYAPSLGLWRVQAGPFNSLNRAEDLSDELNRQYPGNFVVAD